jgi:hypothetical protein
VRRIVVSLAVVLLASACSGGQPSTFALGPAAADPTYWCPGNARNAPYDVHATVSAHNGTSSAVTIIAITAQMTLQDVDGTWLEKTGDSYNAGVASFTPRTVKAGGSQTIAVKFQSACTSAAYGAGGSSFGDYRITLHIATTAGSYSISAGNLHRILAA